MNDALAYNQLASRLYRSIKAAEADTSQYDDPTAEVLGLILGAFSEVAAIVEVRLVGNVADAGGEDTGEGAEEDDDQIN